MMQQLGAKKPSLRQHIQRDPFGLLRTCPFERNTVPAGPSNASGMRGVGSPGRLTITIVGLHRILMLSVYLAQNIPSAAAGVGALGALGGSGRGRVRRVFDHTERNVGYAVPCPG